MYATRALLIELEQFSCTAYSVSVVNYIMTFQNQESNHQLKIDVKLQNQHYQVRDCLSQLHPCYLQ